MFQPDNCTNAFLKYLVCLAQSMALHMNMFYTVEAHLLRMCSVVAAKRLASANGPVGLNCPASVTMQQVHKLSLP